MTPKPIDLGDRLNALRVEYLNTPLDTEYENFDIGVKLIIAAALVELVKMKRDEQP